MAVVLENEGDLAILTLDRKEALNALSFEILRELSKAFDEVAASKARVLIITGAGEKAFCAGADIKELQNRSLQKQLQGAELGQSVFAKLETFQIPSIAAINGFAFGGGLELALACTFRVASTKAKMGLPEIKLGLIPGYGGTQRLPRLIGESRALDLVLTGRTIDGAEAERIGLVARLTEGNVLEAAIELAGTLKEFSGLALDFARRAVTRAADLPLAVGLKAEAELSTLAYRTRDAEEGMAAFAEKRKAVFRNE
jgi:enoyl-CoA hydratase